MVSMEATFEFRRISAGKHRTLVNVAVTNTFAILFENFSFFRKLKGVIAYCLRFCNNCKFERNERTFSPLKSSELSHAMAYRLSVRQVQQEAFC